MSFPAPAPPSPWRWWVAGLLLAATTLNYMDRVALNQTATDIQLAFQLSDTRYARLESGFVLAFGVGAVCTGVLVDRFGVRRMYPLAVLGWSAAGFLTGFSQTYQFLLGCRVMLGIFEAGNWPCGIRTVRQVMPPRERTLGVAIFQSGTGLGATVTPWIVLGCILWADPDAPVRLAHYALGGGPAAAAAGSPPDAWQFPFRVIGVVGLGWVALWVLSVPGRVVDPANAVTGAADYAGGPFYRVFLNRKYWLLVLLVTGVNTTWHTFRVWLPLYLEKQLGYSKVDMSWFTFSYYLTADVGSWTVGLTVLGLTRVRINLFRARMSAFTVGVGLVMTSALLPFLDRMQAIAVIFVTGFGALGLFATYFALSQEVSGRHQGKVSGTLGVFNSVYLAVVYEAQGRISDALKPPTPAGPYHYDWVLSAAGVPALLALVAVYLFWPRDPVKE